jgi:hypothetical protein
VGSLTCSSTPSCCHSLALFFSSAAQPRNSPPEPRTTPLATDERRTAEWSLGHEVSACTNNIETQQALAPWPRCTSAPSSPRGYLYGVVIDPPRALLPASGHTLALSHTGIYQPSGTGRPGQKRTPTSSLLPCTFPPGAPLEAAGRCKRGQDRLTSNETLINNMLSNAFFHLHDSEGGVTATST